MFRNDCLGTQLHPMLFLLLIQQRPDPEGYRNKHLWLPEGASASKLISRGNGRGVQSPENDGSPFPALHPALWKTPIKLWRLPHSHRSGCCWDRSVESESKALHAAAAEAARRSLHIGYLAVLKDHLHVLVGVDLLRPEVHDLVRVAERPFHLVLAHAEFDGFALDR